MQLSLQEMQYFSPTSTGRAQCLKVLYETGQFMSTWAEKADTFLRLKLESEYLRGKARQNAENKQTFDFGGKIEIEGKSRQNAENKQTFDFDWKY